MTLGWGIAATGRIARLVGSVVVEEPGMRVAAVGSRSLARASGLAADLGGRPHGSYAELVADPDVDAVYVATPHTAHAEVVELALRAGKPVLCEKPLTADLAETERLVGLSRSTDTFLMEGMWTRFNPLVQQLAVLVRTGALGKVRSVSAAFGFVAEYDASGRLWNPDLGGGALLDVGIYPVDLARLLLGDPLSISASGNLADTGVDSDLGMLLTFTGGARALLEASIVHAPPAAAVITGTLGSAVLGPAFHAPTSLVVDVGDERVEHTQPDRSAGYRGELRELALCVAQGRAESTVVPLGETMATMRVLDDVRRQLQARGPR